MSTLGKNWRRNRVVTNMTCRTLVCIHVCALAVPMDMAGRHSGIRRGPISSPNEGSTVDFI